MACLYRLGLDQVVVQRYMACRTLSKARRTLFMGAGVLLIICIFSVAMTLTLIVWFQGCDPQLAGAIRRYDQILPFYVKHYLGQFKGFTGIFLAAVVCAATSTTSSIINSQAAVLYVDALSQLFPNIDSHLKLVTRTLAFFLGVVMTLYSCVCVYLGSITRVILMVKSAATGPFTGLLLLAVGFPFVHSKGAGTSTLLMLAFQMFILWQDVHYGPRAPRMPATLNDCPDNRTFIYGRKNNSSGALPKSDAPLFRLSPCWSCFFSTFATVFLGLAISLASGEHRQPKAHVKHLNKWFVRLWRKLGINESCQPVEIATVGHPRAITTKPLLNEERENRETVA